MAISFNSALGIHEQALYLRADRSAVLGNNLANVDTPNFKARDVDFSALLDQANTQLGASKPVRTDARHMTLDATGGDGDLLYTVPSQPSIDGNTVEEHREMARFAKNSMDFEASLFFLNSKFKGLQTAIVGQ
jgi:flagellar basal-body rod protein FlgB